jgi:hypothetical protein
MDIAKLTGFYVSFIGLFQIITFIILTLYCSTMSVQFIIAGVGPVENKNERKIVNFNLSHIVFFFVFFI